jgi:hypothetical protein
MSVSSSIMVVFNNKDSCSSINLENQKLPLSVYFIQNKKVISATTDENYNHIVTVSLK